jgi:S-DNA-T family DNA segregation ATPase FtsK/SpoIIIE
MPHHFDDLRPDPPGERRPGRLGRLARAAAARARIPELPPAAVPSASQTWNPLAYLRQQRAGRPRWQRGSFIAVLGALLTLTLGAGQVLAAAVGPIGAVAAWPVLEWPGRIAAIGAGIGWAVLLLGWRSAIPVIGLTVFGRWFTGPDTDDDDAGTPAVADPVPVPVPLAVPPADREPDPDTPPLARKLAGWPKIAEAAGLGGSRLERVLVDPWGWSARLLLRPGQTLEDAVRQLAPLESSLEVRPRAVRIEEDPTLARRVVLRVVERDPHAEPIAWPGPRVTTITEPLELGLYETGEPVRVSLLRQHTLIGGIAGGGKSGLVNAVMAALAACGDVVVWGVDLKRGMELRPWAGCLDRLATTPADATRLLAAAKRVVVARAELLAARGRRAWQATPAAPLLVVLIDEHAELADESDLAAELVEDLAQLGRAPGVQLVTATQRPTVAALGSGAARAQLDVRICLRIREARDTDLVLGQGAYRQGWRPDRLDRPGKFLIAAPSQALDRPRPARAYWLDDQAVRTAAVRYTPHRPRLDPTSAHAADADNGQGPAGPPPPADGGDRPDHDEPGRPPDSPTPPPPAEGDPDATLLAALRAAGPDGIGIADLLAVTGRRRTWLYDRLADLATSGHAEQVSRGRWRATQLHHSDPPDPDHPW